MLAGTDAKPEHLPCGLIFVQGPLLKLDHVQHTIFKAQEM